MLENELLPAQTPALPYAAFPQLLLLLVIHLWIAHRQEPWVIELGASSIAGVGRRRRRRGADRATSRASRTPSRCSCSRA